MEKVRKNQEKMPLEQAIDEAIDCCIQEHVLEDSHLDYTWEKREPLIRKEKYERSIEVGKEQGINALITSCKEFEVGFEETRKKIQEKFSLDEGEAEKFMKKYW